MLYLIGLGLDLKNISIEAKEKIKKCRKIYFEIYTSAFPYSAKELEKKIGKKIIEAEREFLEQKNTIIEEAKKYDVALLVYGDPLFATTHVALILRAKKENVKCKVIHSSSVFSAVAETGLQPYKFGKVASIPKWSASYKPESFFDIIDENQKIGAHTLLLLDKDLDTREALACLKEVAEKRKKRLKKIILCEKIGTEERKIKLGSIDKLMKEMSKQPACIIVPARLHFFEEECLKERIWENF